jgi:hypothetical protein
MTIEQLKEEQNTHLRENVLKSETSHNLSTIVNPSILKLTEEQDTTGLHALGAS